MSLRSDFYSTNDVEVSFYGHDWIVEIGSPFGEEVIELTSDQAHELGLVLLQAARMSSNKKWEYEKDWEREKK